MGYKTQVLPLSNFYDDYGLGGDTVMEDAEDEDEDEDEDDDDGDEDEDDDEDPDEDEDASG